MGDWVALVSLAVELSLLAWLVGVQLWDWASVAAVVLELMERTGQTSEDMFERHADLE